MEKTSFAILLSMKQQNWGLIMSVFKKQVICIKMWIFLIYTQTVYTVAECVCVFVYMAYENTNVHNDMGITM